MIPWRGFELGASLGIAFFPGVGPNFSHTKIETQPAQDLANPGAIGNAPASEILANERALGAFYVWVPQVSIGYPF